MFETLTLITTFDPPTGESSSTMSPEMFIGALYVFALAAFLGYQVISRVPPLLHTPLMSATNAISAISVVGALVTAGGGYNRTSTILGFLAVVKIGRASCRER